METLMKRIALNLMSLTALSATVFLVACDWESGSQANFNMSQRADDSNISNEYVGVLSGGRAVERSSGGSRITRLIIQQSGKNISVQDNQGSKYSGFIGTRTVTRDNVTEQRRDLINRATTTANDVTGEGERAVVLQVGFSGFDRVAQKEIEFNGFIEIVTLVTVRVVLVSAGTVNSPAQFELIEQVETATTLKGNWVEAGGLVSQVVAQVRLNPVIVQPIPLPTPTPSN
jgi:hypothetical protein